PSIPFGTKTYICILTFGRVVISALYLVYWLYVICFTIVGWSSWSLLKVPISSSNFAFKDICHVSSYRFVVSLTLTVSRYKSSRNGWLTHICIPSLSNNL